jgi:hypothetical protein
LQRGPYQTRPSIALGRSASAGASTLSNTRRLTLHTNSGVVPVSTTTTAFRAPLRRAAAAIQAVVSRDRSAGDPPIIE